jgi:hypothetical protein
MTACWLIIKAKDGDKLSHKHTHECRYLGMNLHQPITSQGGATIAFRLFDMVRQKIVLSTNVNFLVSPDNFWNRTISLCKFQSAPGQKLGFVMMGNGDRNMVPVEKLVESNPYLDSLTDEDIDKLEQDYRKNYDRLKDVYRNTKLQSYLDGRPVPSSAKHEVIDPYMSFARDKVLRPYPDPRDQEIVHWKENDQLIFHHTDANGNVYPWVDIGSDDNQDRSTIQNQYNGSAVVMQKAARAFIDRVKKMRYAKTPANLNEGHARLRDNWFEVLETERNKNVHRYQHYQPGVIRHDMRQQLLTQLANKVQTEDPTISPEELSRRISDDMRVRFSLEPELRHMITERSKTFDSNDPVNALSTVETIRNRIPPTRDESGHGEKELPLKRSKHSTLRRSKRKTRGQNTRDTAYVWALSSSNQEESPEIDSIQEEFVDDINDDATLFDSDITTKELHELNTTIIKLLNAEKPQRKKLTTSLDFNRQEMRRPVVEEEWDTTLKSVSRTAKEVGTVTKHNKMITAIRENKVDSTSNRIRFMQTDTISVTRKVGQPESAPVNLTKGDETTITPKEDVRHSIDIADTQRAKAPELYVKFGPAREMYIPQRNQAQDMTKTPQDQQKVWRLAIADELISLLRKKVFDLVPRQESIDSGQKPISLKIVCAVKDDKETGRVKRFKARLVARGFLVGDISRGTFDNYSPTARNVNIRAMIACVLEENRKAGRDLNYRWASFDVSTAFLNSKLEEHWTPVYAEILDLFLEDETFLKALHSVPEWKEMLKEKPFNKKDYVFRLVRALYGLNQASALWALQFMAYFEANGWKATLVDKCILVYRKNGMVMLASIHVDDSLIAYPQGLTDDFEEFVTKTKKEYEITFERDPKDFVGVSMTTLSDGAIKLSLGTWIDTKIAELERELDREFNIKGKEAWEPIDPNVKFVKLSDDESKEEMKSLKGPIPNFHKVLGILQYANQTCRPDIAYACCVLSQHQNTPSKEAVRQLYRTLDYLKRTKDYGLILGRQCEHKDQNGNYIVSRDDDIQAFCDSNFGGDPKDFRYQHSVMCHMVYLFGSLVYWNVSRIKTICVSTYHAELTALREALFSVVNFRKVYAALLNRTPKPETPIRHDITSPPPGLRRISLWTDNVAAQLNATNPRNYKTNRYIEIMNNLLNEACQNGTVTTRGIGTDYNMSDSGTKALAKKKFEYFRSFYMSID